MAKKKKTYRRRRRARIGLGELAMIGGVIADVSGAHYCKNPATDAVRITIINPIQKTIPGPAGAIVALLGYKAVVTEVNKAGLNVGYGPVRLL